MALLEDMFTGNAATGLAIGIGAVLLGPSVLPALGRALRPVAKAAIKGGMVLYRETFAEIGEYTNDLIAEARNELEAGQGGPIAAAAGAVTGATHEATGRTSGRGGTRGEAHRDSEPH
ncbi:MAG TPA: DUF5132 domain-containing protein [Stellaceae bacterium]|nr:DUF5132 domain-containing protein [Stellaceae bacterium]